MRNVNEEMRNGCAQVQAEQSPKWLRLMAAAGISTFFIYISHFSFLISHLNNLYFLFKE